MTSFQRQSQPFFDTEQHLSDSLFPVMEHDSSSQVFIVFVGPRGLVVNFANYGAPLHSARLFFHHHMSRQRGSEHRTRPTCVIRKALDEIVGSMI